jgi:peptidase E
MTTATGPVVLLAGGPGTRRDVYRPLLRELLAGAGKARPRVAYLGAATDDDPRFTGLMERLVRSAGDCAFALAPVAGRRAARGAARAVLEDADLVLLGGGDVELGMRRLAERDLSEPLARKHAAGTPLLGVSAGAILLCRRWIRWRDPDDDGSAEPFDCLALAPILCDCHGEADGWAELRALLRLAGEGALGHGLRAGAALRLTTGGRADVVCGTVDRLALRRGAVVAL